MTNAQKIKILEKAAVLIDQGDVYGNYSCHAINEAIGVSTENPTSLMLEYGKFAGVDHETGAFTADWGDYTVEERKNARVLSLLMFAESLR